MKRDCDGSRFASFISYSYSAQRYSFVIALLWCRPFFDWAGFDLVGLREGVLIRVRVGVLGLRPEYE